MNQTDQDFVAVKRGDVDGSWLPPAVVAAAPKSKTIRPSSATREAGITVVVDSVVGAVNDLVNVKVLMGGCTNLNSMQFSLGWDTNLLSYQRVGNFGVNGIGPSSFGPPNPMVEGRLALSWDDAATPGGISLSNGAVLFAMEFLVLHADTIARVDFADLPAPAELIVAGSPAKLLGIGGVVAPPSPVTAAINPVSAQIVYGGGIVLECQSVGGVLTGYQWRKNGIPIPGEVAARITLQNITREFSGRYSVLAADGRGVPVVSSETLLSVLIPQQIFTPIKSSDDTYTIDFGGPGGQAISSTQLPRLVVQSCTDLKLNNWIDVPIQPILTNGVVRFATTNSPDQAFRFFRAVAR